VQQLELAAQQGAAEDVTPENTSLPQNADEVDRPLSFHAMKCVSPSSPWSAFGHPQFHLPKRF
jgi:hypothetical protein